jgi:hypothetical protein
VAVTGTDAALDKGAGLTHYSLACDAGSFAVTGTAATVTAARYLSAEAGSFSVSGTAATVKAGRYLSAEAGSFAATGTASATEKDSVLSAEPGGYTVSGTAATLLRAGSITVDPGSFSLAGTDATLTKGTGAVAYSLACDAGTFSVSGTAAGLSATRYMAADAGSLSVSGTAASVLVGRYLAASPGSVVVSGVAAALSYLAGATLTPQQALLVYELYLLHGLELGSPLTVSSTARAAGAVTQTIAEAGVTVTVSTDAHAGSVTGDVGTMVEELAAIYGLATGVDVTDSSRAAGSVAQTIAEAGGTTTVTRT